MIKYRSTQKNLHGLPKVNEVKLPNGVDGNYETILIMKEIGRLRAAHPIIRELALSIVFEYGVKPHHYIDEARAIGDWVKNNVKYIRDAKNVEQLHDPLMMIEKINNNQTVYGDCDDMVLLIASLLLSIGHDPYLRMVRYTDNKKGPFQHIYIVIYDSNFKQKRRRLAIDAIIPNKAIGYEVPHKTGEETKFSTSTTK